MHQCYFQNNKGMLHICTNVLNLSHIHYRYAALLLSMMAPGCRYLLDNFSYDETHYIGNC